MDFRPILGAYFSHVKVQSNHGLAINLFMISWRDSLNHSYQLLVLQAQIIISFSENWRKKWIFSQYRGQFFPHEAQKLPCSCYKCLYDILERFSKSFLSITSFIIPNYYWFFRKLAKNCFFGQFWGQFFPPKGPKPSWFCRKYLWSTF